MTKQLKIMSVFGTRPEAIKLAPVIHEMEKRGISGYETCLTGQHREMLDQMLKLFKIKNEYDLKIMSDVQSLEQISSRVLLGIEKIFEKSKPDLVLVQGDTTTALMGALAAFYKKIPVAHIEAGLRTSNKYDPFPEEMNRRLITQIANLHFAPTSAALNNLTADGIDRKDIYITGNTVIDALFWVLKQKNTWDNRILEKIDFNKRVILVTTHRRENLGRGMKQIFKAINSLSKKFLDVTFLFPVHLNPKIRKQAKESLQNNQQVNLIDPLSYSDLVQVLDKCYFVMTDSGGIQEEAPSLGKPVLVLRNTTEREEGIAAGTAKLVGTNASRIETEATMLLSNDSSYKTMANAVNPYGDGTASHKIVDILVHTLRHELK